MPKKKYVKFETVCKQMVLCPLGGRSYAVGVERTCSQCDYLTEIIEKNMTAGIPAKVRCQPPQKFANDIFEMKHIDFNKIIEK